MSGGPNLQLENKGAGLIGPALFCIGSTEPQPGRDGDKPKPRPGDQEETPLYKVHRGRAPSPPATDNPAL